MPIKEAIFLLNAALSPSDVAKISNSILATAENLKIQPLLIVALIHAESRFGIHARSGRNYGLGQVRVSPTVNRHLLGKERVLFDPEVNIRHMARLLAYWKGYHRRHCRGGHHWISHYQHGKRVRDGGASGGRVLAIYRWLSSVASLAASPARTADRPALE
jgi:hypothetical protein